MEVKQGEFYMKIPLPLTKEYEKLYQLFLNGDLDALIETSYPFEELTKELNISRVIRGDRFCSCKKENK